MTSKMVVSCHFNMEKWWINHGWLVVTIYWECHHPNWLIFFNHQPDGFFENPISLHPCFPLLPQGPVLMPQRTWQRGWISRPMRPVLRSTVLELFILDWFKELYTGKNLPWDVFFHGKTLKSSTVNHLKSKCMFSLDWVFRWRNQEIPAFSGPFHPYLCHWVKQGSGCNTAARWGGKSARPS